MAVVLLALAAVANARLLDGAPAVPAGQADPPGIATPAALRPGVAVNCATFLRPSLHALATIGEKGPQIGMFPGDNTSPGKSSFATPAKAAGRRRSGGLPNGSPPGGGR